MDDEGADDLPDDLSEVTCENFEDELNQLLDQYENADDEEYRDHLDHLIGELKKFSKGCSGYE